MKVPMVPLLIALCAVPLLAAPPARLGPGQPLPDLRLPTADGQMLSLASLKGKVVLIDFWASWCGPCRQSFPALSELYEELHASGLEVVAINLDEKREDANRFLAERPHAMPVVFDPGGTSAEALKVEAMPSSFLVGRDGRIRFVHVGYTEKTLQAYREEIAQLLAGTQHGS